MVSRCLLAAFAGEWEAAEQFAVDARTLGHRLGQPAAEVYAVGQLVPIYRHRGEVGELEGDLRAMIAKFPGLPTLSADLALMLAETGRPVEAAALVDQLSAGDFAALPRDSLLLASWAILAEAVVALNDGERAGLLLQRLSPYADRNLIQGVPIGWGSGAWHLARLLRIRGDLDGAKRYATLADLLHGTWGARAWGPALADVTGPQDAPRPLSVREGEVLRLLAGGKANREIGSDLHLSVHTVERHIANIFLKLQIRNRTEATAWAYRHGMVP
jgi:DNA-binding CsgD family transcriptional regulator